MLAYSTVLLNTDAHNPQVKNRMTKAGFIANNRGINDGHDLPEDLLNSIYDDIVNNEIRMKDEIEAPSVVAPGPGIAGVLANVGRDLQKEAYVAQSNNMANKTEVHIRHHLHLHVSHVSTGSFPYSHAFAEARRYVKCVLQCIAWYSRSTYVRGGLDSVPGWSVWTSPGY